MSLDWDDFVAQIKAGEPASMEKLYSIFRRGIRYWLVREIGPQDMEDRLHDSFIAVVEAIQKGQLREAPRLMGFIRTVVHRQIVQWIGEAIAKRESANTDTLEAFDVPAPQVNPEMAAIQNQETGLIQKAIGDINPKERAILVRFYLLCEPKESIMLEMGMTDTQFRLFKSRAKAHFGAAGKRRLAGLPPLKSQAASAA